MIRAVIFDLDQTLLDRSATFKSFTSEQFRRFHPEHIDCDENEYWNVVNELDDNGYKDKQVMFREVCEKLNLSVNPNVLFRDFKEHYGKKPILFNGVIEMLEILKENYVLAVITNGRTKAQSTKIRVSGIEGFFDEVTISESVGVKKPSPIIFNHCLAKLELQPEHCVYVGDNPRNDVEAAKAIGMKSLWVKNDHFEPPAHCDGVIEELGDLYDLLETF